MASEIINVHQFSQQKQSKVLPTVLTIAGSDSSGGAGIEADIKTISSHGCYALTCITALTAQNTQGVISIHTTPEENIKDILKANLSDVRVDVIKTGMLSGNAIKALSEFIEENPVYFEKTPIVLDPVMIATTGAPLCDEKSIKLCIEKLFSKAELITPNFDEALKILKISTADVDQHQISACSDITCIDDLKNICLLLHSRLNSKNILIKGGHIPWTEKKRRANKNNDNAAFLVDVLYESSSNTFTLFKSKYINTLNTHGTGCTLASSISSNLAKKMTLRNAIYSSINYIHSAMSTGLKIGNGNGPLNHLVDSSNLVIQPQLRINNSEFEKNPVAYFKSHPTISSNWRNYINHEIITLISTNTLSKARFTYFLEQDYIYLINYSRIHAYAAAKAPSFEVLNSEVAIIKNVEEEMKRHVKKLAEYGIHDLSSIKPGPACVNYCNYLMKIAETKDYLTIKTALAPCLHGYGEAASYGLKHPELISEGVYYDWLCDYSSDWYLEAGDDGVVALQNLAKGVSADRIEELIVVFNEVTKLEAYFWDEVLSIDVDSQT